MSDADAKKAEETPAVQPKPYSEVRKQPRVRPQWDPFELAHAYLDEMERGGRLHGTLRRKP
jgi:hypothetical protein